MARSMTGIVALGARSLLATKLRFRQPAGFVNPVTAGMRSARQSPQSGGIPYTRSTRTACSRRTYVGTCPAAARLKTSTSESSRLPDCPFPPRSFLGVQQRRHCVGASNQRRRKRPASTGVRYSRGDGAQTTGALARVDPSSLGDAQVLIRFVQASSNELVEDIIRYNNSQATRC